MKKNSFQSSNTLLAWKAHGPGKFKQSRLWSVSLLKRWWNSATFQQTSTQLKKKMRFVVTLMSHPKWCYRDRSYKRVLHSAPPFGLSQQNRTETWLCFNIVAQPARHELLPQRTLLGGHYKIAHKLMTLLLWRWQVKSVRQRCCLGLFSATSCRTFQCRPTGCLVYFRWSWIFFVHVALTAMDAVIRLEWFKWHLLELQDVSFSIKRFKTHPTRHLFISLKITVF